LAEFTIRRVSLTIPDDCLTPELAEVIRSGESATSEAVALRRNLKESDRIPDLGTGAGFLCCPAGRVLPPSAIAGVGAGPVMAEAARAKLAHSGFTYSSRGSRGATVVSERI
jgi:predicted RNA methylase